MNYVLAVLSHGNPYSDTAERCLDSFLAHVTPMPVFVCYHHDGPGHTFFRIGEREGAGLEVGTSLDQRGFCASTSALWLTATKRAQQLGAPYVLWLEHDFVFTEDVSVEHLAYVLDHAPAEFPLAQMQLMRGAVSREEVEAGGLREYRRRDYRPRMLHRGIGTRESPSEMFDWLEHRAYFTTNVSLMRADFMAAHPFTDDGQGECEGRYGVELVKRGYSFGVWGDGHPMTKHIGVRDGSGHSY